MKNNPIIPYILIMAFGIGLIFFMSMEGVGNKEEIANEASAENGATAEEGAGGADLVASCITCHGGDLTGTGMAPSLVVLDSERIVDVLVNGIPGTPMAPNMKTPEQAQAIADYISTLK